MSIIVRLYVTFSGEQAKQTSNTDKQNKQVKQKSNTNK